MRLPSASQLDRAVACPASLTLPVIEQPKSDVATRGIVLHKFMEVARTPEARATALAAIADEETRSIAEAIDVSVVPEGAEAEVAFGWDPATDTGRRYDITDRGYPDDGLVHGTADLVFTDGDDHVVHVWDFKTGRIAVSPDTWQLKFLALAACRFSGATQARVSIMQLGFSGKWFQATEEYGPWDLDEFAATLQQLPARAATASFSPGDHCRYCPSIAYCPAQSALARSIVQTSELPVAQDLPGAVMALTLEQAGELWPKVQRAEALIESIKDALKTRARQQPLPLPDGREVKEITEQRRSVKPGIVPMLVGLVGAEAVLEIASVSAADVEKKFPKEIVDILRSQDLIGTTQFTKVQAVGKKEKKKK